MKMRTCLLILIFAPILLLSVFFTAEAKESSREIELPYFSIPNINPLDLTEYDTNKNNKISLEEASNIPSSLLAEFFSHIFIVHKIDLSSVYAFFAALSDEKIVKLLCSKHLDSEELRPRLLYEMAKDNSDRTSGIILKADEIPPDSYGELGAVLVLELFISEQSTSDKNTRRKNDSEKCDCEVSKRVVSCMREKEKLRAKLIEINLHKLIGNIQFDIMLDMFKRWFEEEDLPSDENQRNEREYDRSRS